MTGHVQTGNHRPTGIDHADAALSLLNRIDRGIHSAHDPAAARVHAVLAVADALADVAVELADLRASTAEGRGQ